MVTKREYAITREYNTTAANAKNLSVVTGVLAAICSLVTFYLNSSLIAFGGAFRYVADAFFAMDMQATAPI